jgi:hypothetical protein
MYKNLPWQFELGVKDDNYDTCKTANMKMSNREILSSGKVNKLRTAALLMSVC